MQSDIKLRRLKKIYSEFPISSTINYNVIGDCYMYEEILSK